MKEKIKQISIYKDRIDKNKTNMKMIIFFLVK